MSGTVGIQSGSNMAHEIDLTSQEFEHAAIERHEVQLTQYSLDGLLRIRGLRLPGPQQPTDRIPMFFCTLAKRSPREILHHLDSGGIAIRAGDLASLPLLTALGVTAAARASCSLYTQREDIDRLCGALEQLARTKDSA
jgi:cysteine desulfurase/selenocysteine lyase